MKLSIVTTLYKSAAYVQEFYERATAVAQEFCGEDYEIIFVNDGSPDNSLELIVRIADIDSHLTVIDFSRNFGQHKAMMTALSHAGGDYVFILDGDLEEKPEWLMSFAQMMQEKSCDVVYGVQEKRRGGVFDQWSGTIFWKLFNLLTSLNIPQNIVTARLTTKRYNEVLIQHKERECFIGGLWYVSGFDQQPLQIKKDTTSETNYTFRKKLSLMVNAITSFSSVPLVSIFYIGLGIFCFSLLYVAYLVINKMLFGAVVDGWTSIVASIWLVGGMIISFVGIVGIYLAKVFSEVKQRPYTIIKKIYKKNIQKD